MVREHPEFLAGVETTALDGTPVVVTGSTDGIGREAALAFARLGATVLVHGRDEQKGRAVVEEAADGNGDGDVEFVPADFASVAGVEGFADAVVDRFDELGVLVNNAGGYFTEGRRTEDGVETTIAVNHLAPYLLTHRLLPLVDAIGGRVVTTSSAAHRGASIDFDTFRSVDSYSPWRAYGQSKLANVQFTLELARRLDDIGSAVRAHCLHPGVIPGSSFNRQMPAPMRAGMALVGAVPDPLTRPFLDTVEDGAANVLYASLSSALDGENGTYIDGLRTRRASKAAYDETVRGRLWEVSAELTGVNPALDLDRSVEAT